MSLYKIILFSLIVIMISVSSYADTKPIVSDSRVRTIVYNPNEIFELRLNHNYQSYIELSKGEVIKSIAIGDNSSWRIVPTGNKIFIRPLEEQARTNMMIITNKYSYTFDLVALKSIKDADMTYILRFYYPAANDKFDQDNSVDLLEDEVIKNSNALLNSTQKINHHYSFVGNDDLIPQDIFDNAKLTFFKFKGGVIPKIFVIKDDGSEYSTEMLSFEGLILINGVYDKLMLRYQDKKLEIIRGDSVDDSK